VGAGADGAVGAATSLSVAVPFLLELRQSSFNIGTSTGSRMVLQPLLLLLLLALFFALLACNVVVDALNVALHAQVDPEVHGFIVGSVLTTQGMKHAMEAQGHFAKIFYPFSYAGLFDRKWDLVIIEGYVESIGAFIHEARRIAYPNKVIVLFYCLDPDFPGLETVRLLDVDGIMTNSRRVNNHFEALGIPSLMVPLAVDPGAFPFIPIPPTPLQEMKVVYVGTAGALSIKAGLAQMLIEAIPWGLDIYGKGWDSAPAPFSQHWRGVLPQEDLAHVYGNALAVLGVTMDGQREWGCYNNRVFEALSTGSALISDWFPELEEEFGDMIYYVREPGDVARHLALIHGEVSVALGEERWNRRHFIENNHTWHSRVKEQLAFADNLRSLSASRCTHSCLSLHIVTDPGLGPQNAVFASTFMTAVAKLNDVYRITWLDASSLSATSADTSIESDIVWAVGAPMGVADLAVRRFLGSKDCSNCRKVIRAQLMPQVRGLVVWGEKDPTVKFTLEAGINLDFYDAVTCCTDFDFTRAWAGSGTPPRVKPESLYQHAWGVMSPPPLVPLSEAQVYACIAIIDNVESLASAGRHIAGSCPDGRSLLAILAAEADIPLLMDFIPELQNLSGGGEWQGLPSLLRGSGPLDLLLLRGVSDVAALQAHMAFSGAKIAVEPHQVGSRSDPYVSLWVASLALTLGGKIGVPRLEDSLADPRVAEMYTWANPPGDETSYAALLMTAVSRSLCLGRGHSAISLDRSLHGAVFRPPVTLPILPVIMDFRAGRDGHWCLVVQEKVTMCVQRSDVLMHLSITSTLIAYEAVGLQQHTDVLIPLRVELRGVIYDDVISASEDVAIFVQADGRSEASSAAAVRSVPDGNTRVSVDIDARDFVKR
jgi:hypothetical protein